MLIMMLTIGKINRRAAHPYVFLLYSEQEHHDGYECEKVHGSSYAGSLHKVRYVR